MLRVKKANRQIIQNNLRLIQEYAYPHRNVLIKTRQGYVMSNKRKTKPRPRQIQIRRNQTDSAKPGLVSRSPGLHTGGADNLPLNNYKAPNTKRIHERPGMPWHSAPACRNVPNKLRISGACSGNRAS